RAHLGVGPALQSAGVAEPLAEAALVPKCAVVAEREPAGRVVERLRVGRADRRQLRRPPQVHEQGARLLRPDLRPTGVIVDERAGVAVGVQLAVLAEPGRAPAVAGDAVALEAIGERPEHVDSERRGGAGDVLLAHQAAMIRSNRRWNRRRIYEAARLRER